MAAFWGDEPITCRTGVHGDLVLSVEAEEADLVRFDSNGDHVDYAGVGNALANVQRKWLVQQLVIKTAFVFVWSGRACVAGMDDG